MSGNASHPFTSIPPIKHSLAELEKSDLRGPSYARTDMSEVVGEKLGKAEVRNLWGQIFVEKDIACFNISMNNLRLDFFMEEFKSPGNPYAYFSPSTPGEVTSFCGREGRNKTSYYQFD